MTTEDAKSLAVGNDCKEEGKHQVEKTHYAFSNYLSKARWSSYWHQIGMALQCTHINSALYVGVGDNVVPSVLEALGIRVQRFDFDSGLGVDYVGDVRSVGQAVGKASVDVVICCQVLEHVPFEDFESTVAQLVGVARRRVVISLPYCHYRILGLRLKFPKFPCFEVDVVIPQFWRDWKFDGQHYWEVGSRGYSKTRVESVLRRYGRVVNSFRASENPYHLFYVLEV